MVATTSAESTRPRWRAGSTPLASLTGIKGGSRSGARAPYAGRALPSLLHPIQAPTPSPLPPSLAPRGVPFRFKAPLRFRARPRSPPWGLALVAPFFSVAPSSSTLIGRASRLCPLSGASPSSALIYRLARGGCAGSLTRCVWPHRPLPPLVPRSGACFCPSGQLRQCGVWSRRRVPAPRLSSVW